jgi:transcriptional regulator
MYDVAHFREQRSDVLHGLVRAHPLATLVVNTADGLEANHIPLLIDPLPAPHGTLLGHVARGNPLWKTFDTTRDALAVFQGPHGYVTPSWYPSKAEHGKVVPTWNYAVVHAHGPLIIHDDVAWLRDLVTQLTNSQEDSRPAPWRVTDAPPKYIDSMLMGIVGIEIPIRRLQGKWKMSQNRLPKDRAGVMDALTAQPDEASVALLQEMRR